ncbi:MAG: DUF6674 family protein [Enterocloster clostridioformis]
MEAVSAEYHETGRHLKNIGRALMGKGGRSGGEGRRQAGKDGAGPYPGRTGLLSRGPE